MATDVKVVQDFIRALGFEPDDVYKVEAYLFACDVYTVVRDETGRAKMGQWGAIVTDRHHIEFQRPV